MAMKQQNCSTRLIARTLKRAPSTVSRELLRNGWRHTGQDVHIGRLFIEGGYNATEAGKRALRVRRAAKRSCKLRNGSALWCRVRGMLDQLWSPRQIAAILKRDHPGQPTLRASHETIYTEVAPEKWSS